MRHPRPLNWQTAGMIAAPVCSASTAGPDGMVVGRSKKVTGAPDRPKSRSTSRQDEPPAPCHSRSTAALGRGPPVSGTTRMPRDSR